MTTPSPTLPRRSWGRIALVCALILSLIGNAIALGAWARLREARSDLLGPEATAARLPEDLRQELRQALRAELPSLRPLLRNLVQSREAIVNAAEDRPYKRSEAEAAMDTFRSDVDALLVEVQQVLLGQLDARAAAPP